MPKKIRKYSKHPMQVRLWESQNKILDRMFKDETYCRKRGFGSVADVIRTALNPHIAEFEEHERIMGRENANKD